VGTIAPGLANAVNRTPLARAVINPIMKIHPRRSLPRFTRSLFSRAAQAGWARDAGAASVVLFGDCFTSYNESDIGMAAGRALAALGYRVETADAGCCGRSMVSVGMLEQAIETIDATVERLRAAAEDPAVRAIVVCEPSCLSAMKDEWLSLKLRSPMGVRKAIASKAMLPEEFIDRSWSEHPDRAVVAAVDGQARSADDAAPVLLHGHCHQKALWGVQTSAGLLRRLLGERLRVLDTGCCGMAGSFGYARHRYDLSMSIGELGLLPIVRTAPAGAIIVAPGTSCRHQIHDAAGRSAVHPIELAAEIIEHAARTVHHGEHRGH
jgi:Fe-S oxidoreductase